MEDSVLNRRLNTIELALIWLMEAELANFDMLDKGYDASEFGKFRTAGRNIRNTIEEEVKTFKHFDV